MSFLGYLAGGVAEGYGSGLQQQAQSDERTRLAQESRAHEMRMMSLREKLARAREDRTREYQDRVRQAGWDREDTRTAAQWEREDTREASRREWEQSEANRRAGLQVDVHRKKLDMDWDHAMRDPRTRKDIFAAVVDLMVPTEKGMAIESITSKPVMEKDEFGNDTGRPMLDDNGQPVLMQSFVEKVTTSPVGAYVPLIYEIAQFEPKKYGLGTPEQGAAWYRAVTENGENLDRFAQLVTRTAQSTGEMPEEVLERLSSKKYLKMAIPAKDKDAILGIIGKPDLPDASLPRADEPQLDAAPPAPEAAPEPNEGMFSRLGSWLGGGGDREETPAPAVASALAAPAEQNPPDWQWGPPEVRAPDVRDVARFTGGGPYAQDNVGVVQPYDRPPSIGGFLEQAAGPPAGGGDFSPVGPGAEAAAREASGGPFGDPNAGAVQRALLAEKLRGGGPSQDPAAEIEAATGRRPLGVTPDGVEVQGIARRGRPPPAGAGSAPTYYPEGESFFDYIMRINRHPEAMPNRDPNPAGPGAEAAAREASGGPAGDPNAGAVAQPEPPQTFPYPEQAPIEGQALPPYQPEEPSAVARRGAAPPAASQTPPTYYPEEPAPTAPADVALMGGGGPIDPANVGAVPSGAPPAQGWNYSPAGPGAEAAAREASGGPAGGPSVGATPPSERDFAHFVSEMQAAGVEATAALNQLQNAPPEAISDVLAGGRGAGAGLIDEVRQVATSLAHFLTAQGRPIPEDFAQTVGQFVQWLQKARKPVPTPVSGDSFLEHVLSRYQHELQYPGATVYPYQEGSGNPPQWQWAPQG